MSDMNTLSGRINQAFTSEYAPTSPIIASTISQHNRQLGSSESSPRSPFKTASQFHSTTLHPPQRRYPPVPLSSSESHFTFPPPQQHQIVGPFGKPPVPLPTTSTGSPLDQRFIMMNQSQLPPSSTSSSFPLANPPIPKKGVDIAQQVPPRPPKKVGEKGHIPLKSETSFDARMDVPEGYLNVIIKCSLTAPIKFLLL